MNRQDLLSSDASKVLRRVNSSDGRSSARTQRRLSRPEARKHSAWLRGSCHYHQISTPHMHGWSQYVTHFLDIFSDLTLTKICCIVILCLILPGLPQVGWLWHRKETGCKVWQNLHASRPSAQIKPFKCSWKRWKGLNRTVSQNPASWV